MADHVLRRDDLGSTVWAAPGDRVVVLLEENPTTGYLWQVSRPDPVVGEPESEFELQPEGGVGAGGRRRLAFPVARAGSGELSLELRPPWEAAGKAIDHWHVQVEATPDHTH